MPIKERPILFRDQMVRAILSGAKTMTRRIVKPQYASQTVSWGCISGQGFGFIFGEHDKVVKCPYGKISDRLWVKEGVVQVGHERTGKNGQYLWPKVPTEFTEVTARHWFDRCCSYTADLKGSNDPIFIEPCGRLNKMFMPRWASRITLEIVGVKVERLQDISIEDSKAEGVMPLYAHEMANAGHGHDSRRLFRTLWDEINGPDSWTKNYWVWIVEFKRIEP
jgi:hypothetical protein